MALAGHTTRLKVNGAAVPVTGQATTSLGGGVYQVTLSTRRVWDRSAAITIKDGGTPVGASFWSFDYLFGKVTFTGYTPSGAVTVDGSYLPMSNLAEVKGFTFSGGGDLLDTTTFDSNGSRQRVAGTRDGSGSVTLLSTLLDDIDPTTGGSQTIQDRITNGTPVMLEALFGTQYLRAWVLLESVDVAAEVAGLVETTLNYQTAPQGSGASVAFGT